ncbi:CBS domain-containing protein [Chondromyces apiculatus]|nr:CBS domain-containing protein [Chondromyces apiculatus]
MTTKVEWVGPDTTVEEAAQRMRRLDIGALPVCEGGRVIGILTDRDIVVRGVSAGYDLPRATVGELASRELLVGHDDQHVDEAARMMHSRGVRRLPIVDAERRLIGIVTAEDLTARVGKAEQAGRIAVTTGGTHEAPGMRAHEQAQEHLAQERQGREDDDPARPRGRNEASNTRGGTIMAERYGMGRDEERFGRGREDERRTGERGGAGGRDYEMSQHRGYGDRDMDTSRGMGRDQERGTGRDYDELQRTSYSRDYDRSLRGQTDQGAYGQQRGYEQGHQRSFSSSDEQGGWGQPRGQGGRSRGWDEDQGGRSMYEGGGMMGRNFGGQEPRMYGQERGYGGEGHFQEHGSGYHGGHQGWEGQGRMGGMGRDWEHQGRMGGMGRDWEHQGRMGGGMGQDWEDQGRMGGMGYQGHVGYQGNMGGMGQGHMGQGGEHQGRMGMAENFGQQSGMRRGPKGYKRSDDRIREELCDKLSDHPVVDSSDVEVKVQGGEVTLTGTVTERRHKHLIEQLAEAISGVTDVRNEVRVKRMDTSSEARGTEQQRSTTAASETGASTKTQTSQNTPSRTAS